MSENDNKNNDIDKGNAEDVNDALSKEYFNLLNNSSGIFTIEQYQYLQHLITSRNFEKFKRMYWKHLMNSKSKDRGIISKDYVDYFREKFPSDSDELPFLKKSISNYEDQIKALNFDVKFLKSKVTESDDIIHGKDKELKQAYENLKNLKMANSELASRIQQERIDQKIPGYVDSVKKDLGADDLHFISLSKTWAILGAIFGISAVIFSLISLYSSIDFKNAKGFELFYLFTRGLIGISILSWLSYICLSNSKKYTHESIRRKDRRHALMFGQVFLQIYGSTATKEEAVLVFKDWNMSGDSAFSDQTEQPPGVQTLWEATKEKIKSSVSEKSSENL